MTIASEIQRLQTAKSCLKTAIENQGVSVPSNLTIDGYYECVSCIKGSVSYSMNLLVVGGGGNGSPGCGACSSSRYGGGGGGGCVMCCTGIPIKSGKNICVHVGAQSGCSYVCGDGVNYIAPGGCPGVLSVGGNSGSGCQGVSGPSGSGFVGGGGGGGAGGCGGAGRTSCYGGGGGAGLCGYGGGGGGSGTYGAGGGGTGGGGAGGCGSGTAGCNATACGGGGGGSGYSAHSGGSGACGVVDFCYLATGIYINATGGNSCYICDGYCVHRFTSDGTFTIVS